VAAGSVALRDLAGQLRELPDRAILPTVKAIKADAARIGGTMSGNKKRPMRLRAVDRQFPGHGAGVKVWRIQGVPVGPWVWATAGTAAHDIRRRKRGKKRKMTVRHPGASGRSAWDQVVARAEQIVPAVFAAELDDVLAGW
jgi:hypothetical protein